MTSPVAKVPITYDAVDVQLADLQIFLEIIRGLNEPPVVRGKDWIVPSRAGRVAANRVNDIVKIELVGYVQADPLLTDPADQQASYRTNVQTVRALFRTNRLPADLVATVGTGEMQSIVARPLNVIWYEEVPSAIAFVSVELEGFDDWAALS